MNCCNNIIKFCCCCFVKKGYSQLNKTLSIDTDNKEVETTYIPKAPDNMDDEYEKIFTINENNDYFKKEFF